MQKRITLLLTGIMILVSSSLCAQLFDFENAVIPNTWTGNTTDFQISKANQLQLNAPVGASQSAVAWPSLNLTNCSWEFLVRYDFAASTTNYALFYLYSTEENLNTTSNSSYYLKIGGIAGSSDKIELYYQQGNTKYKVLESQAGMVGASKVACRIQVIKNAQGIWTLNTDNTGSYNFIEQATAKHWESQNFNFSGIRCVYSATRRNKFFWDDIHIWVPFSLDQYQFDNDSILILHFNQPIASYNSIQIDADFGGTYTLAFGLDFITLTFEKPLAAKTYKVNFQNIFSIHSNEQYIGILELINEMHYYVGQLRISEFMSDPSPSVGLPEVEWIELVNTSSRAMDVKNICISDPSKRTKLPTYILQPKAALFVCSANMCPLFHMDNCIEVAALPSLNNNADSIFVWANDTLLLDYVHYDIALLEKGYKLYGGYSIVRKEVSENCFFSQELKFSDDLNGGSPGIAPMFVHPPPLTFNAQIISDTEVELKMNGSIVLNRNFISNPLSIISMANKSSRYETNYLFKCMHVFEAGKAYECSIDSVITCRNLQQSVHITIPLIYPKAAQKNDLYINEILYNPVVGGVDFIELYNSSNAYVQLRKCHLYNNSSNKILHLFLTDNIVIAPHAYIVLTTDTAILKQHYSNAKQHTLIQCKKLVSLPDDGGSLMLIASNGDTLDYIEYRDDFQNKLLRNYEGYSLEKINSTNPFFAPDNWTSSAVMATPGYENSQQVSSTSYESKSFYCAPCHASVNLNGVNDFVLLHLNPLTQGAFGSMRIFGLNGDILANIFINQLLSYENTFKWNGLKQNGEVLTDGIYVAVAEWWTSDGKVNTAKIAISTSQY
jgi:hypothetical protein